MTTFEHATKTVSSHNTVWNPGGTLYFAFEEDFVEDNVRCIPMIVRFKLDACGIKLKLEEWCRFSVAERNTLVHKGCTTHTEIAMYRKFLQQLVLQKTGMYATDLPVEQMPAWADIANVFDKLLHKSHEMGIDITVKQWQRLTNLQRFALIKLSKQSHESKNLPIALMEFGLIPTKNEKCN